MTLKKVASAVALVCAAAFGSSAMAAPTITNTQTYYNFTGFDWASMAAAWTEGYIPAVTSAGDSFTLYYAGWANQLTGITKSNGQPTSTPRLDGVADGIDTTFDTLGVSGYEYTIFAKLNETVTSCSTTSGGADVCTFKVISGNFWVYYDTTPDANAPAGAWTGFADGTLLLSGTLQSSSDADTFNTATGGKASLIGAVDYTNTAYINPKLLSTTVSSTLQLGAGITGFNAPTSVVGTDVSNPITTATYAVNGLVFQADANQTFSADVPEPSALGLVGLALVGLGAASRRHRKA